jgi:hypothetical protein
MATFLVTNSFFPKNPKKFTVAIDKITKLTGEPGTKFSKKGSDDLFWEIHISVADAIDFDGNPIKSVWKDILSSETDTVDKLIVKAVNDMAADIDWSENGIFQQETDIEPPLVTETIPNDGDTNVNIHQPIYVVLEDLLPAKGIDIETVKLYVDGIEVVPTSIKGNPFKYILIYRSPFVLEEIEE